MGVPKPLETAMHYTNHVLLFILSICQIIEIVMRLLAG
jgi:hypothetical protein